MTNSAHNKVLSRIYGHGRGWSFSQNDFSELGSRASIDLTMHRLLKKGTIRRVIRGIYDYPAYSQSLKTILNPDIDQVAGALARKFGWRIQPSGPTALNLLRLSTQVPARIVYLSDGPNRSYKVVNYTLEFRHAVLKESGFKLRESLLIVQALRSVGKEHITPGMIKSIREQFDQDLRARILKDTKTATGWIYAAIRKICKEESNG